MDPEISRGIPQRSTSALREAGDGLWRRDRLAATRTAKSLQRRTSSTSGADADDHNLRADEGHFEALAGASVVTESLQLSQRKRSRLQNESSPIRKADDT